MSDRSSAASEEVDEEEQGLEAMALGVLRGTTVREHIDDRAGVRHKLAEVAVFHRANREEEEVHFPESFRVCLTGREQAAEAPPLANDFLVERHFQRLAFDGARIGYALCVRHGIPHVRPDDYFAEMLKPDQHMEKVRARLTRERQAIEETRRRRAEATARTEAKKQQRKARLRQQEQHKRGMAEVEAWKARERATRTVSREDHPNRAGRGNTSKRVPAKARPGAPSVQSPGKRFSARQASPKPKWQRPGKRRRQALRQRHQRQ
ncbi:hypothetical protein CDCA_CDCA12G3385 [Cyanidium caldarium]|uniref:Uncharacterized protein n=1 Tax=Cyanidium caldarium TaxID=2771 RepID=A0AAV9IZ67_CYACA|nr:hypothetical protein CDCA_CDCA12G3385 [Cyanidium caldarium]